VILDSAAWTRRRRIISRRRGSLAGRAGRRDGRDAWQALSGAGDIAYARHGATITPIANNGAGGVSLDPEAERPGRIIEVNVMGTVAALEWARTQPRLRRFIYVSSGSVYKSHGPDRPGEPAGGRLCDAAPTLRDLQVHLRAHHGAICGAVRAADRFGAPVIGLRADGPGDVDAKFSSCAQRDRAQGGRGREARAGQQPRRGRSYIHSEDVAHAIISLLKAPSLGYRVYNIAAGTTATGRGSGAMGGGEIAGFHATVVPPGEAEIVQDDTERDGCGAPTNLARIYRDTGWSLGRFARHSTLTSIGSQRAADWEGAEP